VLLPLREEKPKEKLQKYMAEKKDWKNPAQEYIDDIQVIDVFFAGQQYNSWVLNTGLVGMKCHTKQHNTRTIVA
jgi:hypothetical protein